MMNYREKRETGNPFRQEYLDSVNRLLDKKLKEAQEKRREFDKELLADPEGARKKFKETLGWPLTQERGDIPTVKMVHVVTDGEIDIYRVQIEVFEDFQYYGLLFRRNDGKKRPFVISQHGGLGTPEVCSTLLEGETSYNYNDMTQRILQYDVNVFAPQMLLWSIEEYGIDYNREYIDSVLKLFGGSIAALELYCLQRTLDYFEAQEYVDEDRIGMIGLSYGGMYTLYMTAIDKRIKTSVSSSFFCDRANDHERNDWKYKGMAYSFFDAEVAMLVRPRKIYIAMGADDPLFDSSKSITEFEEIKTACPDWNDWTELQIFEGEHEFCPDDKFLKKFMEDMGL
ncbi:MAG: prolyl oligopeptidase family serine peptidase [Clostridia bacterium]|nr:prolyl oligopeptidase family serine peptidase [Clostridia bacterium]